MADPAQRLSETVGSVHRQGGSATLAAVAFLAFSAPQLLWTPTAWATPPSVVSLIPSSGSSLPEESVPFSATYADPDGNLKQVSLRFTNPAGSHVLHARYLLRRNLLSLRNEANTGWLGGISPGTPNAVLETSFARLDCSQTAVTGTGARLTVTWVVAFKAPTSGQLHNAFLWAKDGPRSTTGWVQKGTWIVNRPPQVGELNPANAQVSPDEKIRLTATFRDPEGWETLKAAWVLINTTQTSIRGASIFYNQDQNQLFIHNDDATALLGGVSPGESVTLQNSRFILYVGETTVSGSFDTLTLNPLNLVVSFNLKNP